MSNYEKASSSAFDGAESRKQVFEKAQEKFKEEKQVEDRKKNIVQTIDKAMKGAIKK